MGKFEIKIRKDGEFQFNLKAGNGEIILTSEGYTTKAACLNGIESVRKNSADDAKFEVLEAKNGKLYFRLKAGASQMYASKETAKKGIASVKRNAPEAVIVELEPAPEA